MLYVKDDQAKAILNQASGAYKAKFDDDLPIMNILKNNEVDVQEAQRIFDYVKDLKEPLNGYDDKIFY